MTAEVLIELRDEGCEGCARFSEEIPVRFVRFAERLVSDLEHAGAFAPPSLLDRIARHGEAAVVALGAYIRGALMGIRDRGALPTAIRVLGATPCGTSLPLLSSLLRDCCGETLEPVSEALIDRGVPGALAAIEVAEVESLPISNRAAALAVASDVCRYRLPGGLDFRMMACDRVHRMLLREVRRGQALPRSNRQWTAVLVETLAGLGCNEAHEAVGSAYDHGFVSNSELSYALVCSLLSQDFPWGIETRGSFLSRYRAEYNVRSLRMGSLMRARSAPSEAEIDENRPAGGN